MKTLITFILFIGFCTVGTAQNKIDFTGSFKTLAYYNSVGGDGLQSEKFFGQYRVYNHGGSLRIGVKLTIASNSVRSYTYKGKTYSPSQIPELNNIQIKTITGTLKVHDNRLKPNERERKLEIYIGGYADQSGSLGGNNYEITDKIPESFPNTTFIEFVPEGIYFNSSDLHFAIETYLEKEKDKEKVRQNQEKYDNFLRDADRLFAAKSYDHALAQYYSASYIDVVDKTKAENGIAKTRKILEEETKNEKPKDPNAHTYKSGECKLAGAIAQHYGCPVCTQQNKKEAEAKGKEDKRIDDVKYARAEEVRKAKEAEAKRIAEEKAKKAEEEHLAKLKEARKAKEYEDRRKQAEKLLKEGGKIEIFQENKLLGLKVGENIIASFSTNDYKSIKPLKGTKYYVVFGSSYWYHRKENATILIDQAGNVLTIDGKSKFSGIYNDNDDIIVEYYNGGTVFQKDVQYPDIGSHEYLPNYPKPGGTFNTLGEAKAQVMKTFPKVQNRDMITLLCEVVKSRRITLDLNLKYKSSSDIYDVRSSKYD